MSRQTFTVTHPDGTVSTRTSDSHVYTHAIVGSMSWVAWHKGQAESLRVAAIRLAGYQEAAEQGSASGAGNAAIEQRRIAEDEARIAAAPTEGRMFWVASWSSSYASAAKRCREGQVVVEVD